MALDATTPVNRLLRGIASHHVETTRDAWRALLIGGNTSTHAILDKLDSASWAQAPRGPSAEYFGILLAALHEIDPEAFSSEIERLQRGTLHPMHRKTLEILRSRMSDHPVGHVSRGIPVYVSATVANQHVVFESIRNWTRTNGLSLKDVTRIDIIAEDGQQDYLGRYSLYFSGIILVWPEKSPSRLVSWLLDLRAEHTFYHEVGHHVSGHLEGGSVDEQEKEADAYALKMMCRAHPVLNAGVHLFYHPVKHIAGWYRELFPKHPERKRPS
jgi:hypothetical protein